MFRRRATPTNNAAASPLSPQASRESGRWYTSCANPITTGLLLYIVLFQVEIYRAHNDVASGSQSSVDNRLPEGIPSPRHRRNRAVSLEDCPPASGNKVAFWPRRKPVTPLNPVEWTPFSDKKIKLPYPIFVTSLPKSGTTSIWKFFKCGKQLSSHNWIKKQDSDRSTPVGMCIEDNIIAGLPPFQNCGDVDVYTDTGYLTYDHDKGEKCFYPSIDGLEAIYASYPYASFVNVVRDTEAWYQSLKSWSHSSLFVRFRFCNATGFPNGQSSKEEFKAVYDGHNAMIRQFAADRPSLTYLEVKLEDSETGSILAKATGIQAACWKQCKPQERKCEGDTSTAAAATDEAGNADDTNA